MFLTCLVFSVTRSLGYARVVDGLKMIRDLPELSNCGIVARNLENLFYTFDWTHSCGYDKSWADEEIQEQVRLIFYAAPKL